jgi:hypothetical protein
MPLKDPCEMCLGIPPNCCDWARTTAIETPANPPTAYLTREHLAAALTWIERNAPAGVDGIALVARALSNTTP